MDFIAIHQSKVQKVFGQGTWQPCTCALIYQAYRIYYKFKIISYRKKIFPSCFIKKYVKDHN